MHHRKCSCSNVIQILTSISFQKFNLNCVSFFNAFYLFSGTNYLTFLKWKKEKRDNSAGAFASSWGL